MLNDTDEFDIPWLSWAIVFVWFVMFPIPIRYRACVQCPVATRCSFAFTQLIGVASYSKKKPTPIPARVRKLLVAVHQLKINCVDTWPIDCGVCMNAFNGKLLAGSLSLGSTISDEFDSLKVETEIWNKKNIGSINYCQIIQIKSIECILRYREMGEHAHVATKCSSDNDNGNRLVMKRKKMSNSWIKVLCCTTSQ